MEYKSWVYRNENFKFSINKVPMQLELQSESGDQNNGILNFSSIKKYDEIWGPEAKLEVVWEKIDRIAYHHGKQVNDSIRIYGEIQVSILKKNTEWIRSHECTFWWGLKKQIMQKRLYSTSPIHCIMYCEQSNRLFQFHATIISMALPNYEDVLISCMKSLLCHE